MLDKTTISLIAGITKHINPLPPAKVNQTTVQYKQNILHFNTTN